MKLVKMPKAPKMIVATLSDAQIRKLLAVITQKQPLGYRDYCMVLILLDTGGYAYLVSNGGDVP